jgi:Na+/citrate or Na+/malate symporter
VSRGKIVIMMSTAVLVTILVGSALGHDATETFVRAVSIAVGVGAGGAFMSWRLRRREEGSAGRDEPVT